eukprot:comp16694_c0_seq1/m.14943 comp16694_c0_seq1/g.14943  ORF comp16694_c0_seq1/g.14943 comp16694_c0_seq1/m.14943 type:complete len:178 (-) comp16694_c0_seq1:18-551(-)
MLSQIRVWRLSSVANTVPALARRWLATEGAPSPTRGFQNLMGQLNQKGALTPSSQPLSQPGTEQATQLGRRLGAFNQAAAPQQPQRSKQNTRIEKKRRCPICATETEIDYKNVQLLSQFVSDRSGMILAREATGVCAKQQRKLAKAIKRARAAGLMPSTTKLPKFKDDPKPWSFVRQ